MRYLMLREPERREEIHRYMNKAEWYLAKDGDDTLYSALAVVMGDGREGRRRGDGRRRGVTA